MADDDAFSAPGDDAHVPLPPAEPIPEETEFEPDDEWVPLRNSASPTAADAALPADASDRPAASGTPNTAPAASPPGSDHPEETPNSASSGADWWRGDDVQNELRQDWHSASGEASAAMQEVGHQVSRAAGAIGALGDAVASTAYPAAKKRGLDIRWMRLSVNIPAVVLALLMTYSGRTTTERMASVIAEDGLLAPVGMLLLPVGVLVMLAFLPVGTPLLGLLAHVVQGAARAVLSLLRHGWHLPYVGYLLRLATAVLVWAFCFAVVQVAGRAILRWLTGV